MNKSIKIFLAFLFLVIIIILQDIFLAPEEKKFFNEERIKKANEQIEKALAPNQQNNYSSLSAANFDWSNGNCEGKKGTVDLTAPPMNLEDIGVIYPYGTIEAEGGHVTPIDHQYYYPKNFRSAPDAYPVYAIADGYIISIGKRNQFVSETGGKNPVPDYRIIFEHSCSFWSYVDLVTKLSPEIASQAKGLSEDEIYDDIITRIPVKAGQEIGRIGGRTLDFGVYDSETTLPGFLVLEHYDGEAWKPHTVDPYKFFVEPVRSQLMAKTARSVEPIAGKIDHDIEGKLQGNWFVVGSGGFPLRYTDKNWRNHLAIAPDAFDPSFYIFSSGNIGGTSKSFGIKDPAVTPDKAGMENGIVKYELTEWGYLDEAGRYWDRMSLAKNIKAKAQGSARGVVLLKLLAPRQLKVEVFVGKTLSQVSEFTVKAVIYER